MNFASATKKARSTRGTVVAALGIAVLGLTSSLGAAAFGRAHERRICMAYWNRLEPKAQHLEDCLAEQRSRRIDPFGIFHRADQAD